MNQRDDLLKVKRALISVTKKELISDFAIELNKLGVEIYGTKGTSSFLKGLGIEANLIEDYTGFPEILDGRVKTLHPKIFGGILAKRDSEKHLKELNEHKIKTFDLVCVDLYPVMKVISEGASIDTIIEHIDIGGISLIRASAKAFYDVAVVVEPEDLSRVIKELKDKKGISYETRKELAGKAFSHSSAYDKAICNYLSGGEEGSKTLELKDPFSLRYGENPHQSAKYFNINKSKSFLEKVVRGEISYNNLLDLDGSSELCFGLKAMGYKYVAVIVKHGSPCGVGISSVNIADAFSRAWDCDPLSSYGGVLVLSSEVGDEILEKMKSKFIELIAAPSYSNNFLEKSLDRKKMKVAILDRSSVLELNNPRYRSACGGLLQQNTDPWWKDFSYPVMELKVVSKRKPTAEELNAMKFAWAVTACTKSNSIVITTSDSVLGIGGGSVSRIDACNMAVEKAQKILGDKKPGRVIAMASDGFLPFADSIHSVLKLGITTIIEPGGSIRDDEVIEECNKAGVALVFTGVRHFKH